MKDSIININLETSTAPVVSETRGKEWISYGDANGEWSNLYPQFLIDLYYSSSITAAIINATSEMIAGEDLIISDEDKRDLEAKIKLQSFMDKANSNESLHEVIKKLSFDFKLQGAFALNIVWSQDRTQIAEVYHIDVSKLRCARPDEMGRTTGYYISADWTNTRQNKPYYVPAFNPNDRTSANQIMYSGLYSPNMNSYYIPDYVSCNNWSLLDARISEFHLNNVSSGFSGSFMLNFSNGIPTSEERFQIEQSVKDKFCSQSNAGNFILTFSDDKTRTPEIQAISPSDLDRQYLALQELLTSNICSGHRITSKTLVGIDSTNGFSSNTDELINAANFFLNTVISPFQIHLIKQLRKIFKVNQMDMHVNFVQLKPITVQFDSKTIREVMTQDEIREELGLEPLGDEEVVDETVDFSKTEKTELESWIEEFGEDMPEDWELVDEEIVDGEHNDFDFEKELNKITNERIELAEDARAVTARPNARSTQDGVNKSYNDYYKVRYVYATDEFLTNKSGTSREFCELMVAAKKVYRKEDLVNVDSNKVNFGFGHPTTDSPEGEPYNVFLFKGGPQCRHYFLRRIFKTSLRNAKQPIKDSEIISHTKALSEGFTVKRNDKLVAIAPQRMDNPRILQLETMAYVLFISEERLKDSTTIGLNVSPELLLPYIKQAQKLYVETKLGTDLNQKLKDLIVAGTVNNVGNEAYATLLNDYIAEVLPSYCLWLAVPFLRYKIENGNIYSKTSETGNALSTEESQQLRNEVMNTAEYYMERMIDYIRNNTASFPEYSTNTGADVNPDRNAYYSNMNLERPNQQGTRLTFKKLLRLMKKYYKVKEKNKTKLKEYLKDGTKTTSKGGRRCTDTKHNHSKCSDI